MKSRMKFALCALCLTVVLVPLVACTTAETPTETIDEDTTTEEITDTSTTPSSSVLDISNGSIIYTDSSLTVYLETNETDGDIWTAMTEGGSLSLSSQNMVTGSEISDETYSLTKLDKNTTYQYFEYTVDSSGTTSIILTYEGNWEADATNGTTMTIDVDVENNAITSVAKR